MTTSFLSNGDSHTNIDHTNLEIFSLIWLDPDINVKATQHTEQQLRSIINHLKKFQDINLCQQYIGETSKNDRLLLIVDDQLGREIIPSVCLLRQVISIYIYCIDKKSNEQWTSKFAKIKTVADDLDELMYQVKEDHKIQEKLDEPPSINGFTTNTDEGQSTMRDKNQFVFSQVLINCLLQLKSTDIDINELIDHFKIQYEGNDQELKKLHEFQVEYSSKKVLWWYTRDSFYYRTLNAALRTQNIHMMFLFRNYIFDMHHQLQYNQSKSPVQVYRSQLMSSDELDDLKRYIGQFISNNSFFSSSGDRDVAIFFLGDTTVNDGLKRVLFEINADPEKVTTKPFANITKYSINQDESEVLFMIGSVFRLNKIDQNDDQVWIIQMTLCSDDEHDLKQVFTYMKGKIGSSETNLQILGNLLSEMGQFDLAEKYFNRLLKQLPGNDFLHISLYEDLAKVASQRVSFKESVEWRQQLLAFKDESLSTTNSNTNKINNSNIIPLRGTNIALTQLARWSVYGTTVASCGRPGSELRQLEEPCGLYVHDDLTVYVADSGNHRIVAWSPGATHSERVAGGNGNECGLDQLNQPTDVIVNPRNDKLIICDRGNRRIVCWPRHGGGQGEILLSNILCEGLTMDDRGFLYVSDSEKQEVRRWIIGERSKGKLVAGGNGEGHRLNQLSTPTFLFVDQDHSLYVSDKSNHRVMKWIEGAKQGQIVAGDNEDGSDFNQLNFLNGVLVDRMGTVYVADERNHRVMLWTREATEGRVMVCKDGRGNKPNQLFCPYGLSFDKHGHLYVVDQGNYRIQKYELLTP